MAKDVERGLVTVAGAQRYGVVCDSQGSVDTAATEALRTDLRKSRGSVELFNFGGTLEEIRQRCEEDTGLKPPRPPEFPRHVRSHIAGSDSAAGEH